MTVDRFSLLSVVFALLVGLAALFTGCGSAVGPADDVPSNHTQDRDGALHASGGEDPEANCAACHGITERAEVGVACIDCHSTSFLAN